MKLNKSQRSNLIFLVLIVVLIFTPVGKHAKILVNRLLAFSPAVTKVENREVVKNYNWELRSLDGSSFNLNAAKEKVVLVNLWATWCPPCIAEMPSLQKLYDDYKDKVVFLFVSDEADAVINDFLTKKEYTMPVFHSRSKTPETLFSKSIPATYLINKKGEIVISKKGAADWNSKKVRTLIDELLLE